MVMAPSVNSSNNSKGATTIQGEVQNRTVFQSTGSKGTTPKVTDFKGKIEEHDDPLEAFIRQRMKENSTESTVISNRTMQKVQSE